MAAQRLDLARIWADAVAILRVNADAISALVGMFVLLPNLLASWFLPEPARMSPGATVNDVLDAYVAYQVAHWPIIVGASVVTAFGSLSLLVLLLHPARPTVATALRLALVVLPFYVLASIIQGVAIAVAFILVLPGLYLTARLSCVAPVAAAEGPLGPFGMLKRSFDLTRGNGWRILLLMVVVLFLAFVLSFTVSLVFGISARLVPVPDVARLLILFAAALTRALLTVAIAVVSAAIYRQVTGPHPFS